MANLLIKGARILDPSQELDIRFDKKVDIFVMNGKIAGIAPNITADDAEIIEADGLFAAPGFVDMHVHLREPGQTYKEDIISGCNAAVAGGVTSVACMANTNPICDKAEIVMEILEKAKNARARVYPVASVTVGFDNKILTDFMALKRAGAVAFSDDGCYVSDSAVMLEAMGKAKELEMPILSHAEDKTLSQGKYFGLMNYGEISEEIGVAGIHRAAEDVATAREIALAGATGYPIHICHVSTRDSVEMIRDARRRGVPVTGETAPHYFTLTDEELRRKDANFRMSPPLRTADDVSAIIEGLADGTLSAIATDHAPHSEKEKADFMTAPNGICGLETAFALAVTELVEKNKISLYKLVSLMSTAPAKIIGLPAGSLKLGENADVVLFDDKKKWVFSKEKTFSKSRNTPFDGKALTGKVMYTIVGGKVVYANGELI